MTISHIARMVFASAFVAVLLLSEVAFAQAAPPAAGGAAQGSGESGEEGDRDGLTGETTRRDGSGDDGSSDSGSDAYESPPTEFEPVEVKEPPIYRSDEYWVATGQPHGYTAGLHRDLTNDQTGSLARSLVAGMRDIGFEGNVGCDASNSGTGPATRRPVVIQTGAKVLTEGDFTTAGEVPLHIVRHYSMSASGGIFGPKWSSNLDFKLVISVSAIQAHRPDGGRMSFSFNQTAQRWEEQQRPTSLAWIEGPLPDGGYVLHNIQGGVETYSSSGAIQSIKNRYGIGWTFFYNALNRPETVQHTSGKQIQLTYENGRVKTIKDPNLKTYTYNYNAGGYLSEVLYEGAPESTRAYHYETSALAGAITGISVGGVRYTNYSYYTSGTFAGRVYQSGLADGTEKSTFSYTTSSNEDTTTVTNVEGVATTYTYRPVGWNTFGRKSLAATSRQAFDGCPGAAAQSQYDSNGFLDYEIDWNGIKTDYDYNASGQLLNITSGISTTPTLIPSKLRYTEFTYTADGRPKTQTVYTQWLGVKISHVEYQFYDANAVAPFRPSAVLVTGYDATGAPIETRQTTYTYTVHPNGLIATRVEDGPVTGSADAVTYSFDVYGRTMSIANSIGDIEYSNFTENGQPQTVTDPNDHVTTYGYDSRGRVMSRSALVSGQPATETFLYNGHDKVTSQTFNGATTWVRVYTPVGRLSREYHASNPNAGKYFAYNNFGSLIYVDYSVTESVYVMDQQCLDNGGGPLQCRRLVQNVVTKYKRQWTYDKINRLTSDLGTHGQNNRYTYDNNSNISQFTDSLNRVTTLTYDAQNRLVKRQGPPPFNYITEFEYDAVGNLTKVTDPRGKSTTYVFNGFGELKQIVSPDTGTTDFEYDGAGRRWKMTRNNDVETTYQYDDFNRVTSVKVAGIEVQGYAYDCTGAKGRLCESWNADLSASTIYSYTSEGFLDLQTETINNQSYVIDRDYDVRGRLTHLKYTQGVATPTTIEYGYNVQDQVTSVKAIVGGVTKTVADTFAYMAFGPRASMRYGNLVTRMEGYDTDYRLTSISSTGIQSLTYSINANDLIWKVTNGVNSSATQTYTYDEESRLTGATATSGNHAWSFDDNGNRESHTWGGATDDYQPDSFSNRIPTIAGTRAKTFTADAGGLGNIVAKAGYGGSYAYSYDGLNRLVSVASTTYTYNALGQRVRKAGPLGDFNYLVSPTGEILGETNNGGASLDTIYIRLGGMAIGMIRGGVLYYIHNDHLGRPEVVTDQIKAVKWRATNFAYDRTVLPSSDLIGGLNLGFPGQYYDVESGLWNNWHRYYDASTGRYLQSDPVGLDDGPNTYTYAGNDPVNYVDRTGFSRAEFTVEDIDPEKIWVVVPPGQGPGGIPIPSTGNSQGPVDAGQTLRDILRAITKKLKVDRPPEHPVNPLPNGGTRGENACPTSAG